jgi:hypothetical protein
MTGWKIMRPRYIAVTTYFMSLCASVAFIFLPGSSIREQTTPIIIVVFHLFLAGGSLISIWGAYRKKAIVEAIGIPLTGAALLAYGAVLIIVSLTGQANSPGAAMGIGFLMFMMVAGLTGRLYECWKLNQISEDLDRRGSTRKVQRNKGDANEH